MLRNMGERLVEEVGSSLHHRLKFVLGLSCRLAGIFKVFFGTAKFVFNTLESVHGAGVWCHLVEFIVQHADLLKKLVLKLVIRLLEWNC